MTASSAASGICRALDFDSKLFGVPIATMNPRTTDGDGLDRAIAWCREHRIRCLYFLADARETGLLKLVSERGFRFVDARLTLDRSVATDGTPRPSPGGVPVLVRLAAAADLPALRDIAVASHVRSRFWVDERFDRRACARLYATWIEKSCEGWADAVWVAEHEGRAAGYLSCHRREGDRGEIGLVGVAEIAKGRGLGRALVERGLAWFREAGCAKVSVVTQGANVPAQRLYQAAGFQSASVEFWHHLWFDAPDKKQA
jgi:ribosomal protein S18 acetylase RimI-like enzyme